MTAVEAEAGRLKEEAGRLKEEAGRLKEEAGRLKEEADEPGWEVDPDDEWGVAVITTVGRQLKLRREAAGMRAAEFGRVVGYGEDMVYKIEGGKRIPRQEFLDKADEVLGAGGLLSAAWEDVKKVRYPKKVRALGKLEGKAVEIGLYECNIIPGLLQTHEHARAVIGAAQPPYSPDDVERMVAARLARQGVFERDPAPSIHFVVEEAPLRRQIAGTMAWRQQLERLLEVGRLNHVALQIMPTNTEAHPGLDGRIELLKFPDGTAVGRADGLFNGRPVSDPKQLRILELQYGTIRAQALSPRESLTFIENLLGET
ncbi:helix-turn-helix transcriptional regulator [Streptomyces sp. DSM 41972]|uniref:Helix-turn-helix transcriptional regulator n=1 Tax=Streptomyces althioticus subsp. attaecolombicae TaxID=3075534 RepID=A0ABU3HZY3_9ACTN|nr:helix-turn-helix transcriptional regulator [Streptomyces sp. DSM 41972]SCD31784.1 Helix-turn-helix domain-containing protein [Streptomyces sp. di50b]SCD98846.1 Helix-turn-helix domain-containing protein [Streptomyces sp. di188]